MPSCGTMGKHFKEDGVFLNSNVELTLKKRPLD